MKYFGISGVIFLALLTINDASPMNKKKSIISKLYMPTGRPYYGLFPGGTADPEKLEKVVEDTFTQKVDHFDDSNTATYKQRYWYNDQWYKPGGPQFLLIEGEAAANPFWVVEEDAEWISIAKEVGAIAFLLEHRFFGGSQPTSDLSFASLKYLTSEQALADVNAFITGMNSKFNFTSPRWITWGGSYSAMLSAWARQVYPNNVYAAVASSAPLQAVVDMTGYLETVYHALNNYNSGCASSLHNGMLQINQLVKTESGRSQLSSLFKTCSPLSSNPDDIAYFYYNILGSYMLTVQYSQDNLPVFDAVLTIPELCKRQMDASVGDDLARTAHVSIWAMDLILELCLPVNFQEYIDAMKNAKPGSLESDNVGWYWLCCNEFGFFQTTDSPLVIANMTGENVESIDWNVKQCGLIFDSSMDNATVYNNVNASNTRYKGANGYTGTKVSFPNGSNDPWHVLGVLTQTNNKVYPILIDGSSHCSDMYPARSTDRPSLTQARASIRTHVISWVYE